MSLAEDLRALLVKAMQNAPDSALGPLLLAFMDLGIVEDRRGPGRPKQLTGKRVRNRTPKTKRNDGKCHYPGCVHPAIRVYSMFCKELHGKSLSKAEKRKYNEAWNKKHA